MQEIPVATMTDEWNKLFAPVIGVSVALLLYVSSTIREALFGVICGIVDGILEPLGIIGLAELLFTLISVVPSFIEIVIVLFPVMIVTAGLSSILEFLNRR